MLLDALIETLHEHNIKSSIDKELRFIYCICHNIFEGNDDTIMLFDTYGETSPETFYIADPNFPDNLIQTLLKTKRYT